MPSLVLGLGLYSPFLALSELLILYCDICILVNMHLYIEMILM